MLVSKALQLPLGHYCATAKSHTKQRHATQLAQSNFKPGKAACQLLTAGYQSQVKAKSLQASSCSTKVLDK
jgi:hypothetical protein